MSTNKPALRVAILDLYDGIPNKAIDNFTGVLTTYREQRQINIHYQVFNLRQKGEIPRTNFDVYLSSGGPGDPLITEGTPWERKYFNLINQLEDHNLGNHTDKKYVLFVCHSFQLMCRHYRLGDINLRSVPSFGVVQVEQTPAGVHEPVLKNLANPFYAVDSRSWQVINPDEKRFKELGTQLVAIEKERKHTDLPRAMMAIRYNDHFFATQFHPEAGPAFMKALLQREDKKQELTERLGQAQYQQMLAELNHPEKLTHTYNTLIHNFMDQMLTS